MDNKSLRFNPPPPPSLWLGTTIQSYDYFPLGKHTPKLFVAIKFDEKPKKRGKKSSRVQNQQITIIISHLGLVSTFFPSVYNIDDVQHKHTHIYKSVELSSIYSSCVSINSNDSKKMCFFPRFFLLMRKCYLFTRRARVCLLTRVCDKINK